MGTKWDNVMFGGEVSKNEVKNLDRTKDRPEDEVVVSRRFLFYTRTNKSLVILISEGPVIKQYS